MENIKIIEMVKKGEKVDFSTIISSFSNLFPLLLELEKTPRDKVWHAEGNVLIHSEMVVNEVYQVFKEVTLSEDEKVVLFLSALLHDLAKPLVTVEKELQGRVCVVSPRHELIARNKIFYPLLELVDQRSAWSIMNLVGYHQLPKLLVVREKKEGAYLSLARQAPLKLFYLLELCDMRGRTSIDQEDQLLYLELFKLEAENYKLWDKEPYENLPAFISDKLNNSQRKFALAQTKKDFENERIFSPEEALAKSFNFSKEFPTLYLMTGISGSGKSFWIKKNHPTAIVISLDEIRKEMTGDVRDQSMNGQVIQEAKLRLKTALAKNEVIVWDATNTRRDFRNPIITLGENYGAFISIVLFHKSLKIIVRKNNEREISVPSSVLDDQILGFEVPELNEAHEIIFA